MVDDETSAVVTVSARCRSRAGAGDEVASVLAAYATATPAEPGCISFRAYREAVGPPITRTLLGESLLIFQARRP